MTVDPSDSDFNDEDQDIGSDRLDLEWALASAIRDLAGIALKGVQEPTYAQAVQLGRDIIPSLLGKGSLLAASIEPSELRFYRERAEAESARQGNEVKTERVIGNEIESLESLLASTPDKPAIEARIRRLERLRSLVEPTPMTENQIIQRDVFTAHRPLPSVQFPEVGYVDYRLPRGKGLRVRALHPDRPEAATGADVIYEMYSDHKETARVAALQYKIWHGRALYFSKAPNLDAQLKKLRDAVCGSGLCGSPADGHASYRLPFCVAFLRPTDKLQHPDSRLISSGLHLPVCAVERRLSRTKPGGAVLRRKFFRKEAVTHKVFEELFNTGILGSRWLSFRELETFYQSSGILKPGQRILLHAQEFAIDHYQG